MTMYLLPSLLLALTIHLFFLSLCALALRLFVWQIVSIVNALEISAVNFLPENRMFLT